MSPKPNPFLRTLALASLSLALAQTTHAAALTWTGGSGDWQNSQIGGWSAAWSNTNPDTGTFNGAGGTVSVLGDIVTAIGTTTVGGIHFSAGNYTLQSDSATTIRNVSIGTTTAATSYVTVASGVTATIGDRVRLRKQGTGNGDMRIRGGGTLIIGSGLTGGSASLDTTNATNTSFIEDGGKLVVTTGGTAAFGTSFVVGTLTAGASMEVTGGAVTIGNSSSNLVLGNGAVTSSVGFKMTGGSLTFSNTTNNSTNGVLRIGGNAAGNTTGQVDLEGGVFSANRILENSGGTVNSTLNLHGGTVRALYIDTTDFLSVDNIFIKANGVTIDSNGRSIGISKALKTDLASTGGGLTKIGAGTLSLTGANTYTGPTIITGGKLGITAPYSALTATTINADARLAVTTGATTASVPSVTVNTGGGFEVNTGTYNASTLAGISTATFNANANYVVDLTGTNIPVGDITVLTYTTKNGTGTPSLGNRPPGVTGTVIDTGSAIIIDVDTPQAPSLVWSAGTGDWDLITANWTGATYTEGAVLSFPNLAGDSAVNLTSARSPFSVAIASTSPNTYTFNGSGISGSGSVTKSGTGAATFANANSYSGTTSIQGGTVTIQASRTAAGAGTTVADGATLALEGGLVMPAEPLSLSAQGVGNSGVLRSLSGDNVWNGNVASAGICRITSVAGSLTFNGNITLPAPGSGFQLVLQGDGDLTMNGSISDNAGGATPLSSSTFGTGTRKLTTANFHTGVTNVNGGTLVISNSGALGTTASGTVIPGEVVVSSVAQPALGTLVLSGGITITGEALSIGGRQSTAIDDPHLLNLSGNNSWTGDVTFTTGGNDYNLESQADLLTLSGPISGGTTTGNRNLKLTGVGNGEISGAIINSTATVQITKRGGGTWTLSGPNSYTGNTTIEDGTLSVTQPNFADTSTLTIGAAEASPAVLNLPNAGTDIVATLIIDGVSQPGNGLLYDSVNTGGAITGAGKIQVGVAGYSAWATANNVLLGENGDDDNDGLSNLVEYALGLNPQVSSVPAGTFVGNLLTFVKGPEAKAALDVTYQIETSTTLDAGSWTPAAATDATNDISYLLPSNQPGGKLFARLKVTKP